ncbi:MAG: saccharopine dehydrogenase NADP-binding domain-containing protein [Thermoplasmatales archaeon]|nr:saccharopine dehydrogenase NADP-binding domain-containing protein [Thermoplasmatales archaeon]
MEKTIGVLGASGAVGKKLTKELLGNAKNNVIVAGRKEKKLQEIYNKFDKIIDICSVDAGSKKSLKKFYSKIDMVVNCSGPVHTFKTLPAEAAIEETIPYVESGMSILNECDKNIQEIDQNTKEKGILMITGAGTFPGLSRVLLELASRRFVKVDNVKVSAIFNDPLSMGSAVDLLSESRKPIEVFENGQWIIRKLGTMREAICFAPPFNIRHVYASPPTDTQLHFPTNIKNFTLKLGTPSFLSDIMVLVHSINTANYQLTELMARYLKYASQINKYLAPCGLAIRMDAVGKKSNSAVSEKMVVNLYHPNTFVATATAIACGVKFLLENNLKKTGLFTFGEIVDPVWLLKKLHSKHFLVIGI